MVDFYYVIANEQDGHIMIGDRYRPKTPATEENINVILAFMIKGVGMASKKSNR